MLVQVLVHCQDQRGMAPGQRADRERLFGVGMLQPDFGDQRIMCIVETTLPAGVAYAAELAINQDAKATWVTDSVVLLA